MILFIAGAKMLEEVTIKNHATYGEQGQSIAGLKTINFIYGANASGKTTIGRVARKPDQYPDCQVVWRNGASIECIVYNTDFVSENFKPQMAGIFTLGSRDAATLAAIESARQKNDQLKSEIATRQKTLSGNDGTGGKLAELAEARQEFEDHAWAVKAKFDAEFQEAFSGVRNAKARFADKLFQEFESGAGKLEELGSLQARAKVIFQPGLAKELVIAAPQPALLLDLENAPILSKKIIGKGDVDIAAMIKRLGNSDWVREGRKYFEDNDSYCPFCQQKTDEAFSKSLSDYFDETYLNDIAEIDRLAADYRGRSEAVMSELQGAIDTNSRYLDGADLERQKQLLKARIDLNERRIASKKLEPSTAIKLESLQQLLQEIGEKIAHANMDVAAHNQTVDNIAVKRVELIADIWKFVTEDAKPILDGFAKKKTDLDAAINGLSTGIEQKQSELNDGEVAVRDLEKKITSVQPTVNEINQLLNSFGFRAFKLRTAGDHGHLYEIVRSSGGDASQTLSEGERTFLTFLYFYYLLQGSTSESGVTSDRIVIFDDPVSSLDSDVLFIVSSLIRRTIELARKGGSPLKQVLVLTHNIYFHKEVSFDAKRGIEARADETFWIVKKENDVSILTRFNHNPVKTSYEMLWLDVRENQSPLSTPNILRRIIENYFKILGNMDRDAIISKFEGQEQIICNALFSWVNDGSHNAYDDLYVSCDEASLPKYLSVFREIFVRTDHIAHYNMMMGIVAQNTGAQAA